MASQMASDALSVRNTCLRGGFLFLFSHHSKPPNKGKKTQNFKPEKTKFKTPTLFKSLHIDPKALSLFWTSKSFNFKTEEKLGFVREMWGQERDAPVAVVCSRTDWLDRIGGGEFVGYSHESEHDLGVMVSDFMENGSNGTDSRYSSDSDSAFSHLADNISLYKISIDQYERDLLSVVHSLILSINETKHPQPEKSEICNASCIRFSLVKLLQSSGYDAAINSTKWQGFGKIPGGEHEFIDVINHHNDTQSNRYIIEIDFRSHFEIARAVKPYNSLLKSLPPIFVGSTSKLKKYLQTMEKAAKSSLKQNSMPFPPWRSLAYLEAKWELTSPREINLLLKNDNGSSESDHRQCTGLLKRMKSCIEFEIKAEGLFIPIKNENKWRTKTKMWN